MILAAAADERIDAVVSINPFTSIGDQVFDAVAGTANEAPRWATDLVSNVMLWRVGGLDLPSPIEVVGDIAPRPLLLMHGTADRVIAVAHTERLAAAAPGASLWIAEGAGHAQIVNRYPEQWRRRVLAFLRASLGAPLAPVS